MIKPLDLHPSTSQTKPSPRANTTDSVSVPVQLPTIDCEKFTFQENMSCGFYSHKMKDTKTSKRKSIFNGNRHQ